MYAKSCIYRYTSLTIPLVFYRFLVWIRVGTLFKYNIRYTAKVLISPNQKCKMTYLPKKKKEKKKRRKLLKYLNESHQKPQHCGE